MEACDAAVVDSEGGDLGGEEGLGNFFGDGDVRCAGCADWEGGRGKGVRKEREDAGVMIYLFVVPITVFLLGGIWGGSDVRRMIIFAVSLYSAEKTREKE